MDTNEHGAPPAKPTDDGMSLHQPHKSTAPQNSAYTEESVQAALVKQHPCLLGADITSVTQYVIGRVSEVAAPPGHRIIGYRVNGARGIAIISVNELVEVF